MGKRIVTVLFYVLAGLVVCWTGYRTVDLLSKTTDNVIVPFLGLAVFDGGAIIWTLWFLKSASGGWQRAIALLAAIIDLVLVAAASAADIFIGGQTIAKVASTWGETTLWIVIAATAINLIAVFCAHLFDPKALHDMRMRDEVEAVDDESYAQLKGMRSANAKRLAQKKAQAMFAAMEAQIEQETQQLVGGSRSNSAPQPARTPLLPSSGGFASRPATMMAATHSAPVRVPPEDDEDEPDERRQVALPPRRPPSRGGTRE